jgi:hypothetical protein
MSTSNEKAMRLALEALQWFTAAEPWDEPDVSKAIKALEEALAKQEQSVSVDEPDDLMIAYMSGLHDGKKLAKKEQGEPVAWVDLLKEAQQIVESKFLWKRFIDGTPLANDIACWMTDFAQQHTTPPQGESRGLSQQQRKPLSAYINSAKINATDLPHIVVEKLEKAIEDAHGIAPQQRPLRSDIKPLTVRQIAEFVGTHEYGPEQLKWFRLGEAAHNIKE